MMTDDELRFWMENGGKQGPIWLLQYPPQTRGEMMWDVIKELIRRELERSNESRTTETG